MSHYLKKKALSIVAPLLSGSQLYRIARPFCAGIGQILTLHRVLPEQAGYRVHNHLSLEISPEQLEQTIRFYQQQRYAFVSMDEVYDILKKGQFQKKFVALTFDDGYRDNILHAYPILKACNVPFIIYVATNFPDRKAVLWWYLLEDLVLEKRKIAFEWQKTAYTFECETPAQKERTFQQIRDMIINKFTVESHLLLLQSIFNLPAEKLYAYGYSDTLSWADINQLSEDPLVTIGAHSVHHYPLIQLNSDLLIEEIEHSKTKIEQHTEKAVYHFAYPFGKAVEASHREFEAVKALGFKTGTTTRMGNIFPQHSRFLESLPRISLNRNSNEQVLLLQNSGLLPFLYHKGKSFITH